MEQTEFPLVDAHHFQRSCNSKNTEQVKIGKRKRWNGNFSRPFQCLLIIFLLRSVVGASSDYTTSSDPTNLQRLSRAHLEFALSFFRHLTQGTSPEENVVVSPRSIATILSQLWMGAPSDSGTATQLEEALYYKNGGLASAQVHGAFRSSLYSLEDPDYKNVLQSANAVFVQAGLAMNPTYVTSLQKFYNSTIDEVSFDQGEPITRAIINRWVAKETRGQIPVLLESPIPSETRLFIVNALALRALWNNSFDPSLTVSNGHFHPNLKSRFQIPMMTGKFNVLIGSSSELKCRLLELPFRGRRLSMFILLPDVDRLKRKGDGDSRTVDSKKKQISNLAHLEKNLNADTLKKLFATLREEKGVQVKLPKLRIRSTAPIIDTLSKMGVNDLFDPVRSNLSKISNSSQLHVSAITHKTVIELHEEGAQAAAITATEIQRTHNVVTKYFEVNRPFIFFIWDYQSGALLFIGRVAFPEPLRS